MQYGWEDLYAPLGGWCGAVSTVAPLTNLASAGTVGEIAGEEDLQVRIVVGGVLCAAVDEPGDLEN